jgi:hypothetical protein
LKTAKRPCARPYPEFFKNLRPHFLFRHIRSQYELKLKMTSMITATAWVPRGHAAAFPTKYVFDEDEYGRIAKLAKLQLDDAEDDLEEAREGVDKMDVADDEPGSVSKSNGNSTKKKADKECVTSSALTVANFQQRFWRR